MLKNKQFNMNTMGAFNKFFTAIIILIPFFVLSQKEYFPTNSGVKVVNEPYKALLVEYVNLLASLTDIEEVVSMNEG